MLQAKKRGVRPRGKSSSVSCSDFLDFFGKAAWSSRRWCQYGLVRGGTEEQYIEGAKQLLRQGNRRCLATTCHFCSG
jgi:hypothetical protein